MKYLKKFSAHSNYITFTQTEDYILPNVSYCVNENEVHYKPFVPSIINGHECVDFDLPSGTLWATTNVGSADRFENGNYYQYGKGSNTYQETLGQEDYKGIENPLDLSVDTAALEWGGGWHMPTKAQVEELIANTDFMWGWYSGIWGAKFYTEINNKEIFLPSAGYYNENSYDSGYSAIWCSTPDGSDNAYAFVSSSNGGGETGVYSSFRYLGLSIRPVFG